MTIHTPVTAVYAGMLTIFILILAFSVVQARQAAALPLGDGADDEDDDTLLRRVRAHANAVENVPLALLLMLLLELNGASSVFLHVLGSALLAGRVLHAQGLAQSAGASFGRLVGSLLTWGMMGVAAGAAIKIFLR